LNRFYLAKERDDLAEYFYLPPNVFDNFRLANNFIMTSHDAVYQERDALIKERDALIKERDALIKERDALIKERDALIKERDALIKERDVPIKIYLGMTRLFTQTVPRFLKLKRIDS
jgi:hypothetical protein